MSLVVHPSRFLHYNAGAFLSRAEACLVDPGVLADEVEALVARLGGAEIRFVVLTHADWDHVLGPEHLPPATVVAHETYPDDLDPDGIRVVLWEFEGRTGIVRTRPFEPPLPDLTFSDAMTLHVGDLALQLIHAPGHAASMLIVYDPSSAVLWAADVLSDVEIPSVIHDLSAYERTLDRLSSLSIRTLVPGHGNPTSDRHEIAVRVAEDRGYLAELRAAVAASVAAEQSLEEAVDACRSVPLRRSPEDETVHRLNVEKVYADLGGDAEPAHVGFARAWKETIRA